MRLVNLASGSKGNCYLLENDKECLIIEAGINTIDVKKFLDFKVKKIVGCVISHSHSDHAKFVNEWKSGGVPCFTPYVNALNPHNRKYGNFKIQSFPLAHNIPCYGYIISHKDCGTFLYATDTSYIKYKFKGINHMLIECNHNVDMLDEGAVNYEHSLAHHMSLQTCKDFIIANDNKKLQNVILCHMSDNNINEKEAIDTIKTVTGANVYSAHTDKVIDVSLIPF